MSKREGEPTTPEAHFAFSQKKKKKVCPGCNQWFGSRHFENHKSRYFWHDDWRCTKQQHQHQEKETTNCENSPNCFNSDETQNFVKTNIGKIIREKFTGKVTDYNSDSEEEEVWPNMTLSDIDADFSGHNDDIYSFPSPNDIGAHDSNKNVFCLFVCLCIFICTWQSSHVIPDVAINNLLLFLSDLFNALSAEVVALAGIASIVPSSIYKLYKYIGLKKDNFTKFVVCKKCFKLYKYEDCIIFVEGQQQSKKCNNVIFPNHTQIGRRKMCGEPLLKLVQIQGSKRFYPFKTYCYKSLASSLSSFLLRPDFEDKCEIWRSRKVEHGFLADIFDGQIWKEFQTIKKNNFLKEKQNYGIMLNLDWFQPYEHVTYSVGVIYAVILNLPRNERFKLKNVMLLGIIPDMKKEPNVQSFIDPLIDELKVAWSEGFRLQSFKDRNSSIFKVALMCVGCDIPATRKLCGFLGHGATLGCSKCHKSFPGDIGQKNYGGFNVQDWPERNLEDHKKYMIKVKNAKTQTERDKLESQYGIRYSPIWELPYFDPIRMAVVDPMHNLFQGTAKKMVKLWLKLKILLPDQLEEIQERVDSVNAASNIGAIPRKISSSFGGFTADQWKNWTNVFSIFALTDILPVDDLEVWREFVLASHIITSKFITEPQIRQFETRLLSFCKAFEEKYGADKVTPNMHLHCHLSSCVRDFGPVYSFWLFSFERYNGHLGNLPNNSRSIELQIMRRFTRDAFVCSITLPDKFRELFCKNFSELSKSSDFDDDVSDNTMHQLLYLSKRSAPIQNQDWSNVSAYGFSKLSTHCLEADEYRYLKDAYRTMYVDVSNMVFPQSCQKCTFVTLKNEVYGSWESRHRRSSFIMAYWNAGDGQILEEPGTGTLFPGVVQTFYRHNVIIDNENNIHMFAKVRWLFPLTDCFRYHCGKPVEVWNRDIYDVFGPSAFIPLQRIYCKYVCADGNLSGKPVSFICPLNNALNI